MQQVSLICSMTTVRKRCVSAVTAASRRVPAMLPHLDRCTLVLAGERAFLDDVRKPVTLEPGYD
jgi:hypothetical protein